MIALTAAALLVAVTYWCACLVPERRSRNPR
jgi:hypothetical protein